MAGGYYPSNCDNDIPVHSCDPCETGEQGRIRSVAFVHKDYPLDETNAQSWLDGINAKQIIVIPETNGSVSAGSPKTAPGYGQLSEKLIGYEFAAKFNDPNYISNIDFYNALIGKSNYRFAYCSSSQVHVTSVPVTIIPNTEIKDDLNAEVVWMNEVKWQCKTFAEPVTIPEGVFTCFIPE